MEKNELLKKLGLDEKSSKIYLALVDAAPATISQIARASGIHRPAIYRTLPSLISKELVSTVKKKKHMLYVAEPPEKLKNLLGNVSEELDRIIPELHAAYYAREKKPLVKFLDGRGAIKFVLNDVVTSLNKGDIFYRYSSRKDARKSEKNLPKDYRETRDKKQLERYVISNKEALKFKKPRLERSIKFIPEKYGLFEYEISQFIYGDKVAIVDDNTQTAFIIENPIIAEFQKKLFKVLYDLLPDSPLS